MEEKIYQILKKHRLPLKKREEVLADLLILFGVSETVYCSCDQPLGFEFNKYGDKFCVNCENLVR